MNPKLGICPGTYDIGNFHLGIIRKLGIIPKLGKMAALEENSTFLWRVPGLADVGIISNLGIVLIWSFPLHSCTRCRGSMQEG